MADDLELWLEWEQGSYNRRQMCWFRGLKALVAVAEVSDEQAAAESLGGETLIMLPRRTWKEIWPVSHELLAATEDGGLAGAMAWLDERELIYELHNREER